jgi:TonB-linked SusC/RagA family outer membrane protein
MRKYLILLFLTATLIGKSVDCFSQTTTGSQPVNKNNPAKLISVKIKVIDLEDGSAIDSASITVIGQKAVHTNKEGIAELDNVTANVDVLVTYKGYILQSKKAKANLQFRLVKQATDAQQESSTYSYGNYNRPKDYVTSAYYTISGDELRKYHFNNIIDALAVADPSFQSIKNNNDGDNPNIVSTTQIRGAANFPASASIATKTGTQGVQILPSTGDFVASEITNANQPIYLLNGMQVSLQQIADMDINRVEKISIMKDAGSTVTYGSRAMNGVVLIQTKGREKGNLNIKYTGQLIIANADVSSYNMLTAKDKLALETKAGFYTNNIPLYQQRLAAVNSGRNDNWLSLPLQTGVGTYQSVIAEGGDDNIEYGLDFHYKNVGGVMTGSGRNSFEAGFHIGARFKSFVLRNYINIAKTHVNNSAYGSLNDYEKMNAYWSPYDSATEKFSKVVDQYSAPSIGGGNYLVTVLNPAYNSSLSTTNYTDYFRISNTTNFDWMLGKGFSLNGRLGAIIQMDESDIFLPPNHTMFASYDPVDFFKRGLYSQTNSKFSSVDAALNLNYTLHKNVHFLQATAGVTTLATSSEAENILVQGFTSDQRSNIAFGSGYSNSKPVTGQIQNKLLSAIVNAVYSYDSRYQVEVNFAREGASQFSSNNRYANYWSTGVSWNLHNEHFFHQNKLLNQFRIRANTGVVGGQFFQSYLANTSYNYFTNQQYIAGGSSLSTRGIGLGAYLTAAGNQNLKSPLSQHTNAGFDAVMLNNRLFIRVEKYWQQSTDLVLPIYSPNYTGSRNFSYYDNLGSIANEGYEFSLAYAVINNQTKSIYWNVSFNGLHNTNTIKATSSYIDSLNSFNNSSSVDQTKPQANYTVDQSLTGIWAVPSLGIDPTTGMEKFVKADGSTTTTWSAADKKMMGDYMPSLQGSFGSSIVYKHISFAVYFSYQLGGSFYNQTLADKVENADLNYNVDARAATNRWQKAGDIVPFKALSLNGAITDPTYATSRFVEKNDLINCSMISVGYNWPSFKSKNIPLKNTSISLAGNNLFSITKNNNWERGVMYPFANTFTFKFSTSIK